MRKDKKRLGDMLIEAGVIDTIRLNAAIGQQRQWGGKLGSILIDMGFVSEQSMAAVLEKQLGMKCIPLEEKEIPAKALEAVKLEIAKKYYIMPLDMDKNTLTIAIGDPTDIKTLDEISFMLGVRIRPVLALESDIKNAIAKYYEGAVYSSRVHKPDISKTPETMEIIRVSTTPSSEEQGASSMDVEYGMTFNPEEISQKPVQTKDTFSKTVVDSIAALLIEKGIFTKEELLKKIKERSQKS